MMEIGFEDACRSYRKNLDGVQLQMVHNPEHFEDKLSFDIGLCGHVHTRWKTKVVAGVPLVNVGVDQWGFAPISLRNIQDYLRV
jgi:calcineurin-like phosphoesterase family protein